MGDENLSGNFDGIKTQKFGVEIECTGLTRNAAARAIGRVFDSDACSVLRAYQNGEPTKEAMTRGLFFRGVE